MRLTSFRLKLVSWLGSKLMKYQDVKDLSPTELKKKKKALTQDLFEAKMKNTLGQLSNPLEIRGMRRDLARVNTALVQKVVR